jgi:hypothetical protein
MTTDDMLELRRMWLADIQAAIRTSEEQESAHRDMRGNLEISNPPRLPAAEEES